MNTFFALALACMLSTPPYVDKKPTMNETTTYFVTDDLAIWLTKAGKLNLSISCHNQQAIIEFRTGNTTLYRQSANLRRGAMQTFDLSQAEPGTYQLRVSVGKQVTSKMIEITSVKERTSRLSLD